MLILRCANGIVAWIFIPDLPRTVHAVCVNDDFRIPLSKTVERDWTNAFRTLFQHTTEVAGAVQQALFIPSTL